MRLDMCFTVVCQTHQTRLDGFVATANAEVTVDFTIQVGERSKLWKLSLWLMVYIWQVSLQDRPRCECCTALWAAVHTNVVELIPVNLDALQAESVTTGDSDWISHCVRT